MQNARSTPQPWYESGPAEPKRRLLLLTFHYPPSPAVGALRWEKFTHVAAARGWGLDVFSAAPEEPTPDDRARLEALPPGVRIYRIAEPTLRRESVERVLGKAARLLPSRLRRPPSSPPAPRSLARDEALRMGWGLARAQAAYFARAQYARDRLWAERAAETARSVHDSTPGRHHLVVSCGPPEMAHEGGRRLALRCRLPFVADFRDPWSLKQRIPTPFAGPTWYRLATRYEKRIVEDAALLVLNTGLARIAMEERHPEAADRLLDILSGHEECRMPTPSRPRFLVSYAGSIYLDRDPTPVFSAARRLIRARGLSPAHFGLEFLAAAEGNVGFVRALARNWGLESFVEAKPPLPRTQALERLAEASVLLTLPQDSDLAVPAKLFDYMQFEAWWLVLAERGSATERLLRGTPADVVSPRDVDAICSVLERRYDEYRRGESPPCIRTDGDTSARHQGALLFERLERLTDGQPPPAARAETWNSLWLVPRPPGFRVLLIGGEREEETRREWQRRLGARELRVHRWPRPTAEVRTGRSSRAPVRLPFEGGVFDVVLAPTVLEELAAAESGLEAETAFLRECARVLRPGGSFLAGTCNPVSRRALREARAGPPEFRRGRAHRWLFPVSAYRRALRRAGFRNVRIYWAEPDARLLRRVIPAWGPASRRLGRVEARGLLRGLASRLGAHRLVHPALLLVASR